MRNLLARFKTLCAVLVVGTVVFAGLSVYTHAVTPGIINYQGRVQSGGADFSGTGAFKFALVDGGGTVSYWSNDGSSTTANEPGKAVALTVTKGLYAVTLGDASITNMTAIPPSVFNNAVVKLRIWFDDGKNGSQQLTPDQRITAVGYAFVAAAVDDGSIITTKIADGAVTAAKIAAGVIPSALPPNGAAGGDLAGSYPNPTVGVGAITTGKIADGAVTNAKIAQLPKCQVTTQGGLVSYNPSLKIPFASSVYNFGNLWVNTSPTRLTAPVAGVYHFSVYYTSQSSSAGDVFRIKVNGNRELAVQRISTIDYGNFGAEGLMNVGDYAEVEASGNGQFSGCVFAMTFAP